MRLIALLIPLLLALPAQADQTDPGLPPLFDRLHAATTPAAAAPVEAAIWELWSQSADPVINELMNKAAVGMQIGDKGMAERSLNQVVVLAPDYAEGWNRRATFYWMLGRYDESLADIERTLALEPRHFGALSGKGLVLMSLERPEEAAAAFEAALAVYPAMEGPKANLDLLQDILGKDI